MNLKILIAIGLVASAFSLSCGSSHSAEDNVGPLPPTIQKTYGVRGSYEVASFLAVTTGIKVATDGNNNISTTWASKANSLCGLGTLNPKCQQALFDIAFRVFGRLVTNESALPASSRKWFGLVAFSGAGSTIAQFDATKNTAISTLLLVRLMGRKPTAEEINAVSQTATAILAVTPAPSVATFLSVLSATVAASTLALASR